MLKGFYFLVTNCTAKKEVNKKFYQQFFFAHKRRKKFMSSSRVYKQLAPHLLYDCRQKESFPSSCVPLTL